MSSEHTTRKLSVIDNINIVDTDFTLEEYKNARKQLKKVKHHRRRYNSRGVQEV